MIDLKEFYDGIYDIVFPLINPIPLIKDYQSDTKPAQLYATMRLVNILPVGFKQEYPQSDGSLDILHTYAITLRINFIGKGSTDDASKLHVKTQRPSVIDQFGTLGLHFYDRTAVRDVPKLMSTGFEDRSTFDLQFYTRVSDTDNPGWIEFVELNQTYKNPDNSVIVTDTTVIDLDP